MDLTIPHQIAALERMTVPQLCGRYAEVFAEETPAHNRAWLLKRIAWRLQAQAAGDLSDRARQRAAELARDADLRLSPPKVLAGPAAPERTQRVAVPDKPDGRLPPPGTILTRTYKGETLQVQVLPRGFKFQGSVYKSLSAVAKAITGWHCNGFLFFRLNRNGDSR